MAAVSIFCAIYLLLNLTNSQNLSSYVIPKVTLHAFKPRGFIAWIPGDPRISFIYFEGNFYNSKNGYMGGDRRGVFKEKNGVWALENKDIELKIGDTVRYYIFVGFQRGIFTKYPGDNWYKTYTATGVSIPGANFKVTSLEDPDSVLILEQCRSTVTRVYGKDDVCAGQTVFEDNFNDTNIREDLWQIEQYIPAEHPEFPFVTYQQPQSNPTVFVKNEKLHITPKLQDVMISSNMSMQGGILNLHAGCTGRVCSTRELDTDILPPIVTGKLTSRIAFKYGWVHIRAKLPIGDWLYPEILLEPLVKRFGNFNYNSGVLKIASANGNKQLNNGTFGNKVLRGGLILNEKCRSALLRNKEMTTGSTWGDDFHVYSVKWTPDDIQLLVDGVTWTKFRAGANGLRSWLPKYCRGDLFNLLKEGGKMAPFDHYFYPSLSVAVGGITEFPDDLVTEDGRQKPWRNYARKACLNFWKDQNNWHSTWTQPSLVVDYIKVVAL